MLVAKTVTTKKQVRKYQVSEKSLRRRKRKEILGDISTYEKVFTYRGFSVDDLKTMSLEEEISLMNANIRRSFFRGWDRLRSRFYARLQERHDANKPIRTHLRDLPVTSRMIGMTIFVYNGKTFEKIKISQEMIGHVLGEFTQTRKFPVHVRKGVGASKGTSHVPMK